MKQNNSNINDEISGNISEPMSNKEYKKMIANAKSKYMQDYKDTTNKKSKFMEEKYFNNLLSTYYDDYIKLKNKFNLKDKDDTEKNNLNVDEKDYEIKKENINQIFSGDLLEIQDFNFDVCDNLINEMPKENNYTLLKSTQNKKDYELRLQGFNNNKNQNQKINKSLTLNEEQNEDEEDKVNLKGKNDNEKTYNDKNNDNDKNVINPENNIEKNVNEEKESFEYMENNEQFNENNDNYLILNQQNIDEDLPLFSDIISSKYNKNYRVPFYEHDEEEKNIEIKKVEKIEYDDENKLILVNENKKYMKFEDIIKSDFNEDYKIPEYIIPNDIKKEIEEEQKNKEEQKINNEENKKNDVINNEVNNVIKIKESGAFIEDNDTKVEEKKENEDKKEENDNNNKIKKEEENNNDNYDDEKFEKIDVDKLNEIDDDSGNNNNGNNNGQNNYNNDEENKKYDDFEG